MHRSTLAAQTCCQTAMFWLNGAGFLLFSCAPRRRCPTAPSRPRQTACWRPACARIPPLPLEQPAAPRAAPLGSCMKNTSSNEADAVLVYPPHADVNTDDRMFRTARVMLLCWLPESVASRQLQAVSFLTFRRKATPLAAPVGAFGCFEVRPLLLQGGLGAGQFLRPALSRPSCFRHRCFLLVRGAAATVR